MKKIVLITTAIIIFFMPLSIEHQKAEAAPVLSKVVNASAKKVAKEIIKDTTLQMSMNMVIDYKYTPKDGRKPKAGDSYSFICMPRDKKSNGDCAKPMEIKKTLSEADKIMIKSEGERVLDKKIAGGITATKWGKFLDWFIPIFSIGMGVAVIDYAMSGEVSDLFDEIAYDVLVNLGILTPSVPPNNPEPEPPPPITNPDPTPTDPTVPVPEVPMLRDPNNILNYVQVRVFHESGRPHQTYVQMRLLPQFKGYIADSEYSSPRYQYDTWQNLFDFYNPYPVREIQFGTKQSSSWIKTIQLDPPVTFTRDMSALTILAHVGGLELLKYYPNKLDVPVEAPPLPQFDELNMPRTTPAGTPVKVPAPGSIPFENPNTGEELIPYLKPDGTIGFKTRTGTEILDPDNNVRPKDPVIIDNPDGSKTIKKAPTGEVPNPSPNEDGKIPPKTGFEPPTDPDTGLSCDRLKKPNFSPLSNAITTSFPFSIPWDLMRMFNAVFEKMGSERPSYEYSVEFQGKTHDFKIELPKMFDSWIPFVRGLFLIIFDIGLIYMIYRFTRGSD